MSDEYRYIGNHAQEILGIMRAPGEVFSADSVAAKGDIHFVDMMNNNLLLSVKENKGGEK